MLYSNLDELKDDVLRGEYPPLDRILELIDEVQWAHDKQMVLASDKAQTDQELHRLRMLIRDGARHGLNDLTTLRKLVEEASR